MNTVCIAGMENYRKKEQELIPWVTESLLSVQQLLCLGPEEQTGNKSLGKFNIFRIHTWKKKAASSKNRVVDASILYLWPSQKRKGPLVPLPEKSWCFLLYYVLYFRFSQLCLLPPSTPHWTYICFRAFHWRWSGIQGVAQILGHSSSCCNPIPQGADLVPYKWDQLEWVSSPLISSSRLWN